MNILSESYNSIMARGWESKSVEAQQDEAAARELPQKPRLTREQAAQRRELDGLELSLQRVVQQLHNAADGPHREMLQQAVAELKHKIQRIHGDD